MHARSLLRKYTLLPAMCIDTAIVTATCCSQYAIFFFMSCPTRSGFDMMFLCPYSHAGYAYSGPCAAYAYHQIDPTKVDRVFILGPSHHVYVKVRASSYLALTINFPLINGSPQILSCWSGMRTDSNYIV